MNGNRKVIGRRRGKVFRRLLMIGAILCLAFVLFGAVSIFRLDAWSAFDADKILKADQTLIIYDKDGEEAALLHGAQDRIPVSIRQVPELVQKAFISAEDARFYEHSGVDFIRILGAAWQDIKAGGYVQGASTISQQLIKLSHLSADKTMNRKLEEAVMACRMERMYEKDEILEMYLNYVYFGGGYYGIEAAARGYFGVHTEELTAAQGALLAGILKSPSTYAPHLDLAASLRRRNIILDSMCEYGYLTEDERDAAKAETVDLTKGESGERRGYYIDETLSQACDSLNLSMDELLTGGYRIYTAMDQSLQEYCEALFEEPEMFPSDEAQGAVVVVDASAFEVAAMVGGRGDHVDMGYNRAMRIRRQPGSVIKPVLVYAPALENFGYTAASMILDEQTDFNGYTPNNFGETYYGWVTLRTAVSKSLNVPAVKVFSSIGVESGIMFAKRLGIEFTEQDNSLALALGGFTYGVSPYQIAGAYACFASGGVYAEPTLIRRITDSMGNVLYEPEQEEQRVMSEENAYILTSMMQSVVTDGTGRRLFELSIPLAGKTGTVGDTNGNRDAWMAAYNSEYSAAVWMGCDSAEGGNSLPGKATGGTYPAAMLKSIYSFLYRERPAPDFEMPDGVAEYRIDRYSLEELHQTVLATALTPAESVVREVFAAGTQPNERSGYWSVPEPPTDFSVSAGTDGFPYCSFTPVSEYAVYLLYREDENGLTELLKRWQGEKEKVYYCDTAAKYGTEYRYYIVPYHPELKIDGRQVTGAASAKISYTPQEGFPFPEPAELDETSRTQ